MRADVGDELIVGISCQGDAAFALHALEHGASYVAFGAVFPTATKTDAAVIGPARLAKARQLAVERTPLYAAICDLKIDTGYCSAQEAVEAIDAFLSESGHA